MLTEMLRSLGSLMWEWWSWPLEKDIKHRSIVRIFDECSKHYVYQCLPDYDCGINHHRSSLSLHYSGYSHPLYNKPPPNIESFSYETSSNSESSLGISGQQSWLLNKPVSTSTHSFTYRCEPLVTFTPSFTVWVTRKHSTHPPHPPYYPVPNILHLNFHKPNSMID